MERDVLAVEHQNYGVETFAIQRPRFSLYQRDEGAWELLVRVDTSAVVHQPIGIDADARPSFEAAVVLDDAITLKPGAVVVQKEGYDHQIDENLSNFYYFEHESVENLRVEIFEVSDTWIDAAVTGETIANGSNGRDPDARVSIRTRFEKDAALRRSFC